MDDAILAAHSKLKQIRERKDLTIRKSPLFRDSFVAFDGKERPFRLRYYQIQGVLHLLAMSRFLLGDDTGLGKCRSRNSLVLTDRGLLRLADLAPKNTILTPDTFYPIDTPTLVWTGWEWAPINNYYHCGMKPTKKIRTRRGYGVDGSLVHPLWTRHEDGESFVQMQEIKVGDVLCISRDPSISFPLKEPSLPIPSTDKSHTNTVFYTPPESLTPDLASFLAYTIAEGWTNGHLNINITQDRKINPETHDHIRQLAETIFGWVGGPNSSVRDTQINISSVYIRAYLEGIGVGLGVSSTKCVPWPIFQGTRESIRAFLRAFFDSEGSVHDGVLEVSSASERLLKEIQILLLRFGIVCTRTARHVKGRQHTYWRLTICGDDARTFYDDIGLLTPRKQSGLAAIALKPSNTNLDVVPYLKSDIEEMRAAILRQATRKGSSAVRKGSGIKQFGVTFEKTLNNIRHSNRNPTFAFLLNLLEAARSVGADTEAVYSRLEEVVHNHFFYDPVVSIADGEEEVADIEVDDPRHSFVADGFINHNTIEAIAALCYNWEKDPDRKVLVLTNKSAIGQWIDEFNRFTVGVHAIICKGTAKQREDARTLWINTNGPAVLVMGYRAAVRDFTHMQSWQGFVLVADEATAFKSPTTQVHQVCRHLSGQAIKTWALTATLIKNNLVEGFGIYRVVVPGLFPQTKNAFINDYCIVRMQRIKGNRQVPIIFGYRPHDIERFRDKIDPFFLGRPKFAVATELPVLTTKEIKVDLSTFQSEKYQEALSGLLTLTNEEKQTTKLSAITYCQEIADHAVLLDAEFKDTESEKLNTLIEILGDGGDLEGEKVIVFTRFRKLVDFLHPKLEKAGVRSVRVTGSEDEDARVAAMKAFQTPDSGIQVVFITMAGSEAINLQAAKAIIFYDSPWSAGDYIQILGRMLRIGSIHDRCYAIHMIAKDSVDERVMEVLRKKMVLIEAVIGKRIKGEGDSDMPVDIIIENDLDTIFEGLKADAKNNHPA